MKSLLRNPHLVDKYGIILLLGLTWIYILLRAAFTPVIHDEAETFYIYIQSGNFLPPDAYPDANNHLLNSLLTFGFYKLFGSALFVLRLPNLIAALFYFFFIYRLSLLFKSRINKWAFVLSMTFIHFVIEFFAYSRGYGISMAFLMGSVYYLMRFLQHPRFRFQALAALCIALAASANLTLLNSYILVHVLILFGLIIHYKAISRRAFWLTLVCQIAVWLPVFYFLTKYSLMLRSAGALYYGSNEGFFKVSVGSLSDVLFRPAPQILMYAMTVVFVAAVVVFVFLFFRKYFFSRENFSSLVFPLILGGNIVMTILLCKLFKVNYPEDRAAMYFVLLLAGTVSVIADSAPVIRKRIRLLLFTPFMLIAIQFFMSLSLNFSSYTPEYRIPQSFYIYLSEETRNREIPPVAEAYKEHRTEWYFISAAMNEQLSPLSHEIFPSATAEFVIADDREYPDWKKNYNEILFDSESGMRLLKRKAAVNPQLLLQKDTLMQQQDSVDFFNLIISDTDTLCGKNILFTVDMQVRANAVPFQAAVIAKANSAGGSEVRSHVFELERMQPDWSGADGAHLRISMLLPQIPEGTNQIVIFFFNKNRVPFKIISARTRMYSYS